MYRKIINSIIVFVTLSVILTLQVKSQFLICAKQMLPSADSLAKTLATNIQICQVSASNIDTTGKSNSWTYSFFSEDTVNPINSQMLYFVAESAHVKLDHYGTFAPGISIMSDYWMDSDSALLIAQLLGGSAITKSYPSCIITAWVFQAPAPPFDAEWQIDYDCSGTTRWVRINATTGEYSNSGNFTTTVHNPNRANMPARPELYQSFPNPFNPTCTISFALPKDGFVSLTIVDISGREITRLISRHMQAGYHSQQLNANGETSGIYFSRLESAGLVQTKKLVLIK